MSWYCCGRKRQSGQVLPIAAAAFVLMSALAGLAIDASHNYLVKRNAQNAADLAVLAAAKQMTLYGNLNVPIASGSATVMAAHDFAANNGFNTVYSTACDTPGPSSFKSTWFDAAGTSCAATSGFTNKVTVNSPPIDLPGSPVPTACQGANAFSCVQVVITTRVSEMFTSILGIPFAYVTVGGSAQATLPASSFDAPPPNALTIYQPQAGCDAPQQCFDETRPAARSLLSCTGGTNNCPTFWVRPGTAPKIYGYDGSFLNPPGDYTAVRSQGDMVIQDRTTICDPYNGATCSPNVAIGPSGFSVPGGAKLFCSRIGGGGGSSTPCTTTGQSTLNEIDSNKAGYLTPSYWYPTVDPTGLRYCGPLLLNGQAMYGPCADPSEPYLIGPGYYDYIVINHGNYEFGSGLYDITGVAPVNTATGAGYIANGIDHSQEGAVDFDLCTGGQPNSCPTLTAGVWLGHGGGNFAAYSGPTPGSCTNGVAGSGGGGGDATVISGSGVVFRLEAGGFVSTHEVQGLSLAGAGVGSLASVSGSPLLFDMLSNSFIHLDASQPGSGVPPNTTSGIIYQTPGASAGGFEFNPSMAGFNVSGQELPAIQGQILAYSVTIFGQSGGTMDFRNGYGGGSVPGIGTSGRNENSIITSVTLRPGAPGYSVLTVNYWDEWMMDGYDVYAKINNGSPQFFSQGIWNTVPGPSTPLPPPGNNPGDAYPAYPSSSNPGSYTIISTGPPQGNSDWLYTIPGGNGATIEAQGAWNWGHQNTIPGANQSGYTAKLIYTFPNPAGNYLSVTIFLLDGDRCGDYAYANYTFRSTGGPGPGQQSIGSVSLVQ